jgi:hypothetical protein
MSSPGVRVFLITLLSFSSMKVAERRRFTILHKSRLLHDSTVVADKGSAERSAIDSVFLAKVAEKESGIDATQLHKA